MTTPTTESTDFLALQDEAGHYYLLPRTALEAARVADDAVPALEAVLNGMAGDDVSGHGIIAPQTPTAGRLALGAERFSNRGIIVVGGYEGLRLAGIAFAPTLAR